MNPGRICSLVFGFAALLPFSQNASAALYQITDLPMENSGPFWHNLFHSADSAGGAGGGIKAWFDLDSTQSSTWDSDTGALSLHVKLYDSASLTTPLGSASATSNNFLGTHLNAPGAQDGGVIGTMTWNFDSAATGLLGLGASILVQTFLDRDYVTSAAGFNANSFQGVDQTEGFITLWGADGYDGIDGFDTAQTTLGTDLVMHVVTPVPVPAAVWLLGSGILGLVGLARRPRSH